MVEISDLVEHDRGENSDLGDLSWKHTRLCCLNPAFPGGSSLRLTILATCMK